jgi:hypothetical protein
MASEYCLLLLARRLPGMLRENYPPEAKQRAWAVCPDLDVVYGFDPADSSREIARQYGTLDTSVDGRRQDVWDAAHAGRPALPSLRGAPAPVPWASRRGRPRKRAAGDVDGPPPHEDDFPPTKAGRALFCSARSVWYEGSTGVPLRGEPGQQHKQFNSVVRPFRHDARGIPSRPSPAKVHRVAAAAGAGVAAGALAGAPAAAPPAAPAAHGVFIAFVGTPGKTLLSTPARGGLKKSALKEQCVLRGEDTGTVAEMRAVLLHKHWTA